MASPEDDVDDGLLFVDQHRHHENPPASWGLKHIERTDINQGDIAPLMVSRDIRDFGFNIHNFLCLWIDIHPWSSEFVIKLKDCKF